MFNNSRLHWNFWNFLVLQSKKSHLHQNFLKLPVPASKKWHASAIEFGDMMLCVIFPNPWPDIYLNSIAHKYIKHIISFSCVSFSYIYCSDMGHAFLYEMPDDFSNIWCEGDIRTSVGIDVIDSQKVLVLLPKNQSLLLTKFLKLIIYFALFTIPCLWQCVFAFRYYVTC